MLNSSRVLDYIKSELGFPFVNIELSDEQILRQVSTYTIRKFSQYVPYVKKISMNVTLDIYKVPGRQNEFYIPVADEEEIINVVEVYFPGGDLYLHGHPTFGPLSHGELPNWALQVTKAMDTKMFSSFDQTYEFKHPNIIRISPVTFQNENITVECEMMQPSDFSQVPNEFQELFCELACADIMIIIGRIRKKYAGGGGLRSPFGEITLDTDILDEGKEKRREIIEKLESIPPNISIDIG